MISVEEAVKIIFGQVTDFGAETIPLERSVGRILREELRTDRPLPPYNRVTMDGIAIRHSAFAAGQRTFPIVGVAAAGSPQLSLEDSATCLEVMTGAILPNGTDSVIRYEDLTIEKESATLHIDTVKPGQNVHRKGEDRSSGELVVGKNTKISPAEIGIATTVGKSQLKVARLPKTVIISTGDELVEIDKKPLPHQIRKSNVYRLQATMLQEGVLADRLHLEDNLEVIEKVLAEVLSEYELVLLSGGVSKGKFDFLPVALENLGVKKLFHKIKQRPGKPFWFGKSPTGATVFALPGNPVSSFLCTHRYVLPWLQKCLKAKEASQPHGILTTDYYFKPDLTYFLQVRIDYTDKGQILATPNTGNGSGDFANLVDAAAFLELPRGRNNFYKGEVFPLWFYR